MGLNFMSDWRRIFCRGADKYLAQPGRKKARATEDFDVHISFRCVIPVELSQ
jgi:RNase P subunit RPR2